MSDFTIIPRDKRHVVAVEARQHTQYIALGAIIDGDYMAFVPRQLAIAIGPVPAGLRPLIGLAAGDFPGQIHTVQSGPASGLFLQGANIEFTFGIMGDDAVLKPLVPDQTGQAENKSEEIPVIIRTDFQALLLE